MIWELFLILLSNALSAAVAFYVGLKYNDLTKKENAKNRLHQEKMARDSRNFQKSGMVDLTQIGGGYK